MKRRLLYTVVSVILFITFFIIYLNRTTVLKNLNCIDLENANGLELLYSNKQIIIQDNNEIKILNNLLREIISKPEDFSKLEREIRDFYIIRYSDSNGLYNIDISFSNLKSYIVIRYIEETKNTAQTFCYICDEDFCKYVKDSLESIHGN